MLTATKPSSWWSTVKAGCAGCAASLGSTIGSGIGTIATGPDNLILDRVNVWSFLEDAARDAPDRASLRQGPQQLSYAEARGRALALAADLRSAGVREGDRVGCLMHNHLEHLIAYFGVAAAGAVLVSLNTRLTDGEQRDILQRSGARWLVHDDAHALRAGVLEQELLTVPDRLEPEAQTHLKGPKPRSKHIGPMMSSTYEGYTKLPSARRSAGAPARLASSKNAFP